MIQALLKVRKQPRSRPRRRWKLAVLARDEESAEAALGDALVSIREKWEPETTLRNLREARERRGEPSAWLPPIMDELERAAR